MYTGYSRPENRCLRCAKRVRDISRKPAQEDATTASVDEFQRLKERVAALSAENQELRAQVAELQARLIG